jgi:hypothetical protein
MSFHQYIKLIWDWDSFKGTLGAIAAVVFPFLKILTPGLQFLGAVGGLVLLYYSIRLKKLEYKEKKK